jgi:hypothetical protein
MIGMKCKVHMLHPSEWVHLLLLLYPVDLILQLLQPFNMDSQQQLCRELLGFPSQTGAASLVPLVLSLLASWNDQMPGSLYLHQAECHYWTMQLIIVKTNIINLPLIIVYFSQALKSLQVLYMYAHIYMYIFFCSSRHTHTHTYMYCSVPLENPD